MERAAGECELEVARKQAWPPRPPNPLGIPTGLFAGRPLSAAGGETTRGRPRSGRWVPRPVSQARAMAGGLEWKRGSGAGLLAPLSPHTLLTRPGVRPRSARTRAARSRTGRTWTDEIEMDDGDEHEVVRNGSVCRRPRSRTPRPVNCPPIPRDGSSIFGASLIYSPILPWWPGGGRGGAQAARRRRRGGRAWRGAEGRRRPTG